MRINVEFELTPEELRSFMGLPDVGGVQARMLEEFSERLTGSGKERDEFLQEVFASAMAPWQGFFDIMASATNARVEKVKS